jgi:hypothetical protein
LLSSASALPSEMARCKMQAPIRLPSPTFSFFFSLPLGVPSHTFFFFFFFCLPHCSWHQPSLPPFPYSNTLIACPCISCAFLPKLTYLALFFLFLSASLSALDMTRRRWCSSRYWWAVWPFIGQAHAVSWQRLRVVLRCWPVSRPWSWTRPGTLLSSLFTDLEGMALCLPLLHPKRWTWCEQRTLLEGFWFSYSSSCIYLFILTVIYLVVSI